MKLYLTHQYYKAYLFLKNDAYEFISRLVFIVKRFKLNFYENTIQHLPRH